MLYAWFVLTKEYLTIHRKTRNVFVKHYTPTICLSIQNAKVKKRVKTLTKINLIYSSAPLCPPSFSLSSKRYQDILLTRKAGRTEDRWTAQKQYVPSKSGAKLFGPIGLSEQYSPASETAEPGFWSRSTLFFTHLARFRRMHVYRYLNRLFFLFLGNLLDFLFYFTAAGVSAVWLSLRTSQ